MKCRETSVAEGRKLAAENPEAGPCVNACYDQCFRAPAPGYYICTLPAGHEGPHMGHALDMVAAVWERSS